ncbi:MAG TPA: hypothetical protein P5084_05475 [Paludibacter sp.]|nr:hypothetical protein [Paludibacter sp.]
MRTLILTFTLLSFFIQVKSQETEIYLMQNNSIVKGKIIESADDSLRIRVDSLNTLAFAKTELEGKEFPVSKGVKKLQFKLMRQESNQTMRLFPGMYEIKNGKPAKGKIILVITTLGIVGVITSGVVFGVVLTSISGLYGVLAAFAKSIMIFAGSTAAIFVGTQMSLADINKDIQQKVKNRYYYRGLVSSHSAIITTE